MYKQRLSFVICIITMYIRETNMAYIHTLKYFLNILFLVAALTESLFKCIILDVSPQFSNFIFFIHSIFKKYIVIGNISVFSRCGSFVGQPSLCIDQVTLYSILELKQCPRCKVFLKFIQHIS